MFRAFVRSIEVHAFIGYQDVVSSDDGEGIFSVTQKGVHKRLYI